MKEMQQKDALCLSQIQHWIIFYLDKNQDRDIFQRDLETETHVSRATVSSVLQGMEKKGLIYRSSVSWDARLKKITLSETTKEFCKHAEENVIRMEQLLAKGMSETEKKTLLSLLRRVRENLEDLQEGNPAEGQ